MEPDADCEFVGRKRKSPLKTKLAFKSVDFDPLSVCKSKSGFSSLSAMVSGQIRSLSLLAGPRDDTVKAGAKSAMSLEPSDTKPVQRS